MPVRYVNLTLVNLQMILLPLMSYGISLLRMHILILQWRLALTMKSLELYSWKTRREMK